MKATHTAILKSLDEVLLSCLDNRISASWIRRLSFFTGKEVSLILKDDGHYSVIESHSASLAVEEEFLTNITEIKPSVEIPETPFWFEGSEGNINKVESITGVDKDVVRGTGIRGLDFCFELSVLEENLNNGTWKIVPEPKKESEKDKLKQELIDFIEEKFK